MQKNIISCALIADEFTDRTGSRLKISQTKIGMHKFPSERDIFRDRNSVQDFLISASTVGVLDLACKFLLFSCLDMQLKRSKSVVSRFEKVIANYAEVEARRAASSPVALRATSRLQLEKKYKAFAAELSTVKDGLSTVREQLESGSLGGSLLRNTDWMTPDYLGSSESFIEDVESQIEVSCDAILDVRKDRRDNLRLTIALTAIALAVFIELFLSFAPNESQTEIKENVRGALLVAWQPTATIAFGIAAFFFLRNKLRKLRDRYFS